MAKTRGFTFAYTQSGGPPAIKNCSLVSGTAYKAGAVVRLSATSGSAVRVVTRPTSVYGVLACDVTQTNASSGKYPVYLANEDNVFQAAMVWSATAPMVLADNLPITLASVHTYTLCGTTSAGTAARNVVTVMGYPGDESTTTHTGINFYVKFCRSQVQGGIAPTG